ncbi:hypothetical protein HPP92_010650 [Vanilla planifolia]|uniref:Protein kinase domain-containing protein n=1 Tax=Vanilla planifolia TaxID=51239 RepID=A0A835R4H6_VANPL|nr:hypothetical protein HPP92_010650 [Vanilla planifolia]
MEATLTRFLPFCLFLLLLLRAACSADAQNVNHVLISLLRKLSPNNPNITRDLGWNESSDPCRSRWRGVTCNNLVPPIRSIVLESLDLDGSIGGDSMSFLCKSITSLKVFSFKNNSISGNLPSTIGDCIRLTHIYLNNNRLSGTLPSTLPGLKNLKRLDISNNNFSGDLPPDLSKISGLITFFAQNNHFTGVIPAFDLAYFNEFNVSSNQFSGPLPTNSEKFPSSSFNGNPGLCGEPLQVACPSPPIPSNQKSKNSSLKTFVMILGYVLFGLALVIFLAYKLLKKKKKKEEEKSGPLMKGEMSDKKESENSGNFGNASKSEYSISSPPQSITGTSTSLVMLNKDGSKVLKFEELLRAPAELMGKGRFGSLYKVVIDGGIELAVKRIKDWTVSGEEFQKKITKMDQARHPNILSVTAFYCSKQEKLVVYEYQKNGSLFKLLLDNKEGREFNWASRLQVAAGVSAGLAFMHKSLGDGHGNLKSSNILFSSSMDPLISEYGLTALPTHRLDPKAADTAEQFSLAADVYAFGVVLLELLTGKPSHGSELAEWVHSVVREEWTGEVFDRSLLSSEGEEEEESMVRLLQLALQCMGADQEKRPSMAALAAAVAAMLGKEERMAIVGE